MNQLYRQIQDTCLE